VIHIGYLSILAAVPAVETPALVLIDLSVMPIVETSARFRSAGVDLFVKGRVTAENETTD
jgi:hypothetical protein